MQFVSHLFFVPCSWVLLLRLGTRGYTSHKPVNEVICWIKSSFQQIIAFGPCCLISAWEKHVDEHVMKSEMWTGHVKWKICSEYHETAPLSYILEAEYISGRQCFYMTHAPREDEWNFKRVFLWNVSLCSSESVSEGILCALVTELPLQLLQKHFESLYCGWGDICRNVWPNKIREQVFYCSFYDWHVWHVYLFLANFNGNLNNCKKDVYCSKLLSTTL